MGLVVSPPCVNRGRVAHRGEDGEVRLGLVLVRGLRESTARAIVADRSRRGRFGSLGELQARVTLRRGETEALIRCGAVDDCSGGRSRSELLWEALRRRAGASPPAAGPGRSAGRPGGPETLLMELETLGVGVCGHPIELFGPWLPAERIPGSELPGHVGDDVVLAGWPVTARPLRTAGGQSMELVCFEDETALFDAAVFPAAYRRGARVLAARGPCEVHGRVTDDGGHVSLVVRHLRPVSLPRSGHAV